MGFNPNDPAFVQQLLRLDAPNIVATLRRLDLEELANYRPQHSILRDCKAEVMRTTKALSFSIGSMAQYYCRESKMWHPFECDLAQFPAGMYPTMRKSYRGYYAQFRYGDCEAILDDFPNIETLNLMVDFGSVEPHVAMQDALDNVARLVEAYAPQLVTFRLWIRAPAFVVTEGTSSISWHSTLMQQFVPNLWPALDTMVHCQTLWLELEEDARPFPENLRVIVPLPAVRPLENCLQGRQTLRNMTQLREFRFVGEMFDPYTTMAERLFPLANLHRIYIRNLFSYHQWTNVDNAFTDRFQEINISFYGVVLLEAGQEPLEDRQVTFDDVARQLGRFHALTRIGIRVGGVGLRLITVLQVLPQLAHLQSLQLLVQQETLFSPQEFAIMRNRPVQLAALEVLWIFLDINMMVHEAISMAALFPGREPWQWPPEHSPLPSLVCFSMYVREGQCYSCPGNRTSQDNCIRQAVIRWFEPPLVNAPRPRPPIAKVHYCNLKHRTLTGRHEVKDNIRPPPREHPFILEQ